MKFLFLVLFIVDYFRKGRGVVKREREKMVFESLVMCIDVVVNVADAGVIVGRSGSITEVQVSRVFLNLAETSGFSHVGFRLVPFLHLTL